MPPLDTLHLPWPESTARQVAADASRRITRRTTIANLVTQCLVAAGACLGLLAFLASIGKVGPAPLLPVLFPALEKQPLTTYVIALLPVVLIGVKLGLYSRDLGMNLRRWEMEVGMVPLLPAQLNALRSVLTGEDLASTSFRRWEAYGLTLRQRDAEWLIDQRQADGLATPDIELDDFLYIVDGVLQPVGAPA